MNTKQKGFGKAVIIGLIAAVLIVGAVAYVLIMNSKKTDQATTATQAAATTNKKSAAATLVKTSYAAYLDAGKGEGTPPSAMTNFRANTTSEFSDTLKNWGFTYDPILCGNGGVPISMSYGEPTLDGTKVKMELAGTYANPPASQITVEVDTSINKISRIICHIDN